MRFTWLAGAVQRTWNSMWLFRSVALAPSWDSMQAAGYQPQPAPRDAFLPAPLLHRRPTVVIGHPMLGFGGSESNVMWLIEALKHDYDVTIITTRGWNIAALNAFYGTHILASEVSVRIAPFPFLLRNQDAAALRGACYQRFAQQVAGEYDVRISAYNPTDWGLPAIHFIADFTWHKALRAHLDPATPGFIYRKSFLRKAYLAVAALYASSSGRNVLHDDSIIANSRWTADHLQTSDSVESQAIVYHPVWTTFPRIAWEDKEEAFVMIGRIAPEKQVERAVAILLAVRQQGYPLRLHLCGEIGSDPYGRRIADLCRLHADWIVVEGRVSGEKKATLLARCRFGIHTRAPEPFGIAVAEMVKAGAIVFASTDGGQAEIIQHPDLLFANADEAVQKIQAVLASSSRQTTLRDFLKGRGQQFSAENFMRDARIAIAHALTGKPNSICHHTEATS